MQGQSHALPLLVGLKSMKDIDRIEALCCLIDDEYRSDHSLVVAPHDTLPGRKILWETRRG